MTKLTYVIGSGLTLTAIYGLNMVYNNYCKNIMSYYTINEAIKDKKIKLVNAESHTETEISQFVQFTYINWKKSYLDQLNECRKDNCEIVSDYAELDLMINNTTRYLNIRSLNIINAIHK